jgi:hypothetical protein
MTTLKMDREVRWIVQCRRKNTVNIWQPREDVCYSGWFFSDGKDKPSEGLLAVFEEAKAEHDYLEWRLVQETRTFKSEVVA